jgi:hypothetical protein
VKRTKLLIAALVSAVAGASAVAVPVGPPNVPSMVAGADLIIVGRAAQPTLRPDKTAEMVSISVDRVLKGRADAGRRLTIRIDRSRAPSRGIAAEQYGIFVVRAADRGIWSPVDPAHPVLPASPNSRPARTAQGLPAVASEIASVLETPPSALTDLRTGVHDLVVGTPEFQAGNVYLAAADALRSVPYSVIGPRLRTIARSSVLPGRLWAVAALMQMGSSPQLDDIKAQHLKDVAPAMLRPTPDTQFAVQMLANSIEGRVTSSAAIPTLAVLLGSSEVSVRRAAASVLSDIATPAVVAPLARVGLKDADEDVRYFSVLGLAEATHAQDAPPMEAFKTDPSRYESFWRGWANTNLP